MVVQQLSPVADNVRVRLDVDSMEDNQIQMKSLGSTASNIVTQKPNLNLDLLI